MCLFRFSLPLAALLAFSSSSYAAGDAVNGKTLYQARCAMCHSVDFNGVGPAHRGVFDRPAAQAKGFAYSAALKSSGVVWNAASLDRWLIDPEKMVPGQTMFVGVSEAQERADLIEFLKQQHAKK
jgi:cytochrome c